MPRLPPSMMREEVGIFSPFPRRWGGRRQRQQAREKHRQPQGRATTSSRHRFHAMRDARPPSSVLFLSALGSKKTASARRKREARARAAADFSFTIFSMLSPATMQAEFSARAAPGRFLFAVKPPALPPSEFWRGLAAGASPHIALRHASSEGHFNRRKIRFSVTVGSQGFDAHARHFTMPFRRRARHDD